MNNEQLQRRTCLALLLVALLLPLPALGQSTTSSVRSTTGRAMPTTGHAIVRPLPPKREFRGGWIQVVNGQIRGLSTAQAQEKLLQQVEALQQTGCNAVIFQVRPEADALYASDIEPWSRYLTGVQGQAPAPYWDPLQFMIEACHERGMELHAWINPYRAKSSLRHELAPGHVATLHPERFVTYGDLLLFDPALAENRDYICRVVCDIVSRYDVDGIHLDDYFYPYPVGGTPYPDEERYAEYCRQAMGSQSVGGQAGASVAQVGTGQAPLSLADWRRRNVNLLMEQLHTAVHEVKPWVKLGVSPFGIYRNQSSDPDGSATRGLQNYDDLYADVLLWAEEGWIDYNIPQIYWQIGHPSADYATLVDWWARHACGRPLFIGQSVTNTVQNVDPERPTSHQLRHKMRLQRAHPQTIQGSCQWYAAALVDNPGNYREALAREYHRYPALQPRFAFIDSIAPGRVTRLKATWTAEGYVLSWTAPKVAVVKGGANKKQGGKSAGTNQTGTSRAGTSRAGTRQPEVDRAEMDRAAGYVVYRFAKGEAVNLDDPGHIVAITRQTRYLLPYQDGRTQWQYVVTALDRLHNESRAVSRRVKL